MKVTKIIVVSLAFVSIATAVNAQTLEEMTTMWRSAQYTTVLPLLLRYRGQPGGRTWEVDYLIGTSECRIPGQGARGATVLDYVLANYRLPDETRTTVEHEATICRGQNAAAQREPQFLVISVSGQIASGPLVSGKGGYEVSRSETAEARTAIAPVSVTELEKRVFPTSRAAEAVQAAKSRFPNGWAIAANEFVIAGRQEDKPMFPPETIGECLRGYLKPLRSQFHMDMPPGLVTVYVAKDQQAVKNYAQGLHGVALPLGTVAYSVYEDRSIVGMAGYEACGSLSHELVHLAIRQNFGDSPAWLEEGLASEVAVARPSPKGLTFERSWRDEMLKRHWNLRPSVSKLLETGWASYAARDQAEIDRVAALQAMAAAFIRYLDAQKKLVLVYLAVRDSRWTPELPVARSTEEVVQSEMGKSLEEIDADFTSWFGYKPPLPTAPPVQSVPSQGR